MFFPLAIAVGIASLGVVSYRVLHLGQPTGGFIFEANIDIATGFILLGAASFLHKWRVLLVGLALLAVVLSGAPEAAFALGVLVPVALIRRDWSRMLAAVASPIAAVVLIGLAIGWGPGICSYTIKTISGAPVASYTNPEGRLEMMSPLAIRVLIARDALANFKPLGDGYNLTAFTTKTVHNVPLVNVQQLGWPGVLAGAAWLWVSIWCLVKTKWKYAWALVLTLSVFDHYIWTQLAPFWWSIAGASLTSGIKSDLVFRRVASAEAQGT